MGPQQTFLGPDSTEWEQSGNKELWPWERDCQIFQVGAGLLGQRLVKIIINNDNIKVITILIFGGILRYK